MRLSNGSYNAQPANWVWSSLTMLGASIAFPTFSGAEFGLLRSPRFLDNVIMVVESGYTRRDQLQEGLEALKQSRAKLTGAVLAA